MDNQGIPHSASRTILVGTDESLEGRHAVWAAHSVAEPGTRITILRVVPVGENTVAPGLLVSSETPDPGQAGQRELDRLAAWIDGDPQNGAAPSEFVVAFGVPGIEIGRYAADREVSLIVLGRGARDPGRRLELGETADAVVRRCDRPILFVPQAVTEFKRMVVAIDASERAATVLEGALAFATPRRIGVTVFHAERSGDDGGGGRATMPRARPVRIAETLRRVPGSAALPVEVRQDSPITGILDFVEATRPDLLVIGYRRGGPPKVVGPTEVARNLLHSTSRAVMTIPL